jgi:hypothetical protein
MAITKLTGDMGIIDKKLNQTIICRRVVNLLGSGCVFLRLCPVLRYRLRLSRARSTPRMVCNIKSGLYMYIVYKQ